MAAAGERSDTPALQSAQGNLAGAGWWGTGTPQGAILQTNKELQRMFGFSQSQAQGKQMKELLDLEEFEFKDKLSEISLRDVSGKRIKMSARSNRVELQEQDEYIVIIAINVH